MFKWSKRWIFSSLLLFVPFVVLFVLEANTEATSTTIEMDIKESEMQHILKNERKIAKSFKSKFDISSSELTGDVKLNIKFKKMKGNKQQREVSGKAEVKIGKDKFTFDIDQGSLVKSINKEGEEVYFLDADSTFKTKDGDEVASSLTFAWNKDFSKTEGAIAVGTISDFSYIPFGNSATPIRGITKKDRQALADNQQEFENKEYTEE